MSLPVRYPINLDGEVDEEQTTVDFASTHEKKGLRQQKNSKVSQKQTAGLSTIRKGTTKGLSSSLNHDVEISSYIDVTPGKGDQSVVAKSLSREEKMRNLSLHLTKEDDLLANSVVKPGFEQQHTIPPYQEAKKKEKLERQKERSKTKGNAWYGLPATELTEERKRDLEVIQMRSILDTKQFYKKNDLKVLPKYFQLGTVVDSPVDFYASRVPRKERKHNLVDELLADAKFKNMNKKKFAEIITKRRPSGAYRHAKRLKSRKKWCNANVKSGLDVV
nr:EOG090X0GO7 [Lepidurus arcticus]